MLKIEIVEPAKCILNTTASALAFVCAMYHCFVYVYSVGCKAIFIFQPFALRFQQFALYTIVFMVEEFFISCFQFFSLSFREKSTSVHSGILTFCWKMFFLVKLVRRFRVCNREFYTFPIVFLIFLNNLLIINLKCC